MTSVAVFVTVGAAAEQSPTFEAWIVLVWKISTVIFGKEARSLDHPYHWPSQEYVIVLSMFSPIIPYISVHEYSFDV